MSAAVRAASVAADGRLAAQRQKYWSGCKGGAVLQTGGGGRGGDESRGLVPERRRGCKACSRADEHRAEQPPRHRRRKTRWFCHNLRMGWRARGWRSEGARPEGLTGIGLSLSSCQSVSAGSQAQILLRCISAPVDPQAGRPRKRPLVCHPSRLASGACTATATVLRTLCSSRRGFMAEVLSRDSPVVHLG